MILLVIDTAGRYGSVALVRVQGSDNPPMTLQQAAVEGGTFSAQLVPQVGSLLDSQGIAKQDISGFAVVSGPGSFTGLRVGLAAVKALAEILGKPIAAISLLEAVARSGAGQGQVWSALDAGRGEVYVGDYDLSDTVAVRSERLLSREQAVTECRGRALRTPDGALAESLAAAGIRVELVEYPGPRLIAHIGGERIERGHTVSPESLEANYIRRSDAEIFSGPRT